MAIRTIRHFLLPNAANEAALRQSQADDGPRSKEPPIATKTEQKREVEIVSDLYPEDGKKIVRQIRDLAEGRLAEIRFQGLLESAPDAMIITNAEGKIILVNTQTEKFFGYSREEIIGQPVEVLIPLAVRDRHPAHRQRFHQNPHIRPMGFGLELFGLRRDGTEFPVEISLSPLEIGTGTLVIAAVRDITDRKRAEEALRRSEERYRTLFNSIDEGFCIIEMLFDENGRPVDYRFLEVNPSFERQTGIRGAAGKRMREIAPNHEGHWFEIYGNVALTGQPVRFIKEANALKSWFDVYAFRLGNQDSRKVAILFNNITERKMAEEALRQAQIQLAERAENLEHAVTARTVELTTTNKQMEALLYTIAHDLRAPLRSMQGFSDLLVEEAGSHLSETARDFASRISSAAQSLDAMLRDLIAFNGLARQEIELQSVELESVVRRALDSLQREIKETGARVEAVGPWPIVLGDESTLGAVLVQLLANALKFVAPAVLPVVRLRTEEQEGFIRVWVEDNGIGIAPAHHDQIFRLFTRLHGEKYAGTGFGLAIVKKSIQRMGGRAGVDSAAGQGSRFWFELKQT